MSAVLAFLLGHRAVVGWAVALAAAVAAGGLLVHRLEEPGRLRAETALRAAEAQAAAAQASTTVQTAAAAAVETARTTETHVAARTGAAADALSHSPSGVSPVPPDVLRDWAVAIDGLRDDARAAHAATGPDRAGAARAVPAP